LFQGWLLVDSEAWRGGGGEVVNDSVEAFFECSGTKVEEKSYLEVHEAQISQQLFAVDWRERFHRF